MEDDEKKYKEVVDQNGKTGNSKTTWKYYELFNSAYGNKAGTQAKITYDSERKEKLQIGKMKRHLLNTVRTVICRKLDQVRENLR